MHQIKHSPQKNKSISQRLGIVTRSFHRPEEQTLAEFRKEHRIARTTLYEGRARVQQSLMPHSPGPDPRENEIKRLRQELAALQEEISALKNQVTVFKDKMSHSIEVNDERITRTMMALAVEPVSTRGIHTIIKVAFGSEYAPADNTISRKINQLGAVASDILDEAVDRKRIDHIAPDEIFFHQTPVLTVVHPESTALLNCIRSDDRTAAAWEPIFKAYDASRCSAAADLGSGLSSALKKRGILHQADVFHGRRLWTKPLSIAEAKADKALIEETHIRKKIDDPGRRGPKPQDALKLAKMVSNSALDEWEHLLEAEEAFISATSSYSQANELATRESQIASMDRAISHLATLDEGSRIPGVRTLYRHLKKYGDAYLYFVDDLWKVDVELNHKSPWTAEQIIAIAAKPYALCDALKRELNPDRRRTILDQLPKAYARRVEAFKYCKNFNKVEKQVQRKLDNLKRASSMVECINSKIRPLQSVKKTVNQPFLNLFSLKHNMTPYERSQKRKGFTPYQLLGVRVPGDETGWLGALIHRAKQKGLVTAAA